MDDPVDLLFAVEAPSVELAPSIATLVDRLNRDRRSSDPEIVFVNEFDDTSRTQPDDEPLWTLGCFITLTRPTDDVASERAQLEAVEFVVERLCRFSSTGPAFVVEYDGEEVGSIEDGRADTSLREGLISEWRKRLEE